MAGAPDAERADADAHVRLDATHRRIELLDERVDVRSTPVGAAQSRLHAVATPRAIIRKLDEATSRIALLVWIEVVVEVHGIDVVATYDVADHFERLRARIRLRRIHPVVRAGAAQDR